MARKHAFQTKKPLPAGPPDQGARTPESISSEEPSWPAPSPGPGGHYLKPVSGLSVTDANKALARARPARLPDLVPALFQPDPGGAFDRAFIPEETQEGSRQGRENNLPVAPFTAKPDPGNLHEKGGGEAFSLRSIVTYGQTRAQNPRHSIGNLPHFDETAPRDVSDMKARRA